MTIAITIDIDRAPDGGYIAEVPELPGVIAVGVSPEDAAGRVGSVAVDRFGELVIEAARTAIAYAKAREVG